MQCPRCQHENSDTAKFCEECGTKLARVCPSCGYQAKPAAKFCPECGTALGTRVPVNNSLDSESRTPDSVRLPTSDPGRWTPMHLAERIRAEQAAMEARGATAGERKTITALFADIQGSMDLIEELDPEDARRIIDPALKLMMAAVHRYEGYVAQSTGDGVFALFGAPIAHEDHPQQALFAALKMQDDIRQYAEKLRAEQGINLQIRVGVNTGDVVVRSIRKDDLHTEYIPIGHSTSLAARMESLAAGGSIVASEHTYKLTEGYFAWKPLGAAKVKGVSEPLQIYEVLGIGPLRTRLQVAARRGLVRLVGRQNELAQLGRTLELVKRGQGQVVGVMGEPGVGKSRLFYEFKLLSQKGYLVLETFAVAHGASSPYLPLIELLKHYFQITMQDEERKRREKVTGKVLTLDRTLEDTLPYLSSLLGIEESPAFLSQMDPQIRRQRTFAAIKRLLVRESLNQPLILICEDLHWLDSETQAFLTVLSESVPTVGIMLLVNYRPEYQHTWGNKTYYTQLRLDPLGQEETEEMLRALLGEGWGLEPLRQFVLAKTQGNPFFMEEMIRALVDQGVLVRGAAGKAPFPVPLVTKPLTEVQLPPTVQGILAARIDRLGTPEKALLQTLAVAGKEVSLSLLKTVVNQPEEELLELLAHLQAGEFIYEQSVFPELVYTFKHVLTQEVAYNTLLIERRVALHERIAQAIEKLFHDRLESHYSELASHYTRSGNVEKAIEYSQRAGEQAVHRSAHGEAIAHLSTALELLKQLPDTRARARRELTLHIALGIALVAMKGYGKPEVERVYARARELYQQIEDTPQLLSALYWIWRFYSVRGEFQTARELAGQFARLAQSVQDAAFLLPAQWAQGFTLLRTGEFAAALTHLEQGFALYDRQKHRPERSNLFYMQDLGVSCLVWTAVVLWYLGYPDQAVQRSQQAVALAYELAHPSSLVLALQFAGMVHRLRREGQAAQERAEAVITLSHEHGFPYFVAGGMFVRGWALAEQGQRQTGVAQMQESLATWRAAGVEQLGQPSVVLAELYGRVGRATDGLQLVAAAAMEVCKSEERWYETELYRVKGELILQSDSARSDSRTTEEAEGYFRQAITLARRQGAKSPELRAVMDLSRLRQQQGKTEEARQLLTEVYEWFTEGFDTTDLREARSLLEQLTA